jgi:hypothetical protein
LRHLTSICLGLFVAVSSFAPDAAAQTQIKGRALVTVDTSGSMVWHFGDCNTTGGDGSGVAAFCDNTIGTGFTCGANVACTTANGAQPLFPTTLAEPSRMYAAKAALNDVLNSASGSIDFGLQKYTNYSLNDGAINFCPNATYCCTPALAASGRCVPQVLNNYPDVPGSVNCIGSLKSDCNITSISGCGTGRCCGYTGAPTANCPSPPYAACPGTDGGTILVQPAAGSSTAVMPWIDYVEDFCDNGSGAPRNPELRAAGATPLAGSIRTSRHNWYQPIYNVSKVGAPGYNPASPLFDPKLDCRSYVNVVMTDGVDSCDVAGSIFTDPTTAVSELTAVNSTNPVKTYVIGMAFVANEAFNPSPADHTVCPKTGPNGGLAVVNGQQACSCNSNTDCGTTCEQDNALGTYVQYVCGTDHVCHHPGLAALNAMAAAGGTGSARFANNQTDIEAAFSDIVASTVKVEICDGKDNDCDGSCDEPFPDVLVTNPAPDGSSCSNPHPANACNNGQLNGTHCYATGVFVCSADHLSEVCNAPTCATTPSLCATSEKAGGCNGIDDDCNGVVDDCTPFVANSCTCNNCPACNLTGKPQPETCNGCDDDCDGVVDNHLTDTGVACGSDVGMCEPGQSYCCQQSSPTPGTCTQSQVTPQASNPDKLFCLGGRGPVPEICNGVDDNCNGVTDEISQNCYTGPAGTQNVGICKGGTQACNASPCGFMPNACCSSVPAPPLDTGKACPGSSSFATCGGQVTPQTEICNGLDDNCNGQTDEGLSGDPRIGVACCPSGNLLDCQNTGTGTRCHTGTTVCTAGAVTCSGAVQKSVEQCDGVDDNCDGITDNVAGAGTACTGGGTNTTGVCTAAWACKAGVVGPGPGGLTCTQVIGPSPEVCNGLDDNCNGMTDEGNPGGGAACGQNCPGGTVAGCVGACKAGITTCTAGVLVCNGSTGPTSETCNGIDDNCNGITDDVPGLGDPCSGPGVNTTGICTATLTCNPASPGSFPGGLTCTQKQGPKPEVCNGLDDNCNGVTDENVACPSGQTCMANGMCSGGGGPCDPTVGVKCGLNCPGGLVANCVGACVAGSVACVNGAEVCQGSTGPTPEVCNGIDDDCNGKTDDNLTDSWLNPPAACCPTGNLADCMNTGGGNHCKVGVSACVNGGRVCSGGVASAPEVCNGIDDNCNGITDDVPGLGSACTSSTVKTLGPCTAAYTCNGTAGPGPNGLTCSQIVGPMPERCNGVDDDCDGVVDDHLTCPTGSSCMGNGTCSGSSQTCDPAVGVVGGVPCTPLTPLPGTQFPAGGPAPPCNLGLTVCKAGAVVCQGEQGPVANQCNGISTDCTGKPNTNGNCPSGLLCYQGSCTMACSGGEFPCQGGFRCDKTQNPPTGICIPDKCAQLNCMAGLNCVIDSTGNASCVDPCAMVTCPSGYTCKLGVCLDCTTVGCPTGDKCAGTPPMCVPDPCFNVTCPSGQFCNSQGQCTNPCAMCMKGQICQNGMCVADPCNGVMCPEGQVCSSATGQCIQNQCSLGCNPGTLCCQGMCINDPCAGFACPGGTVCKIDEGCNPFCNSANLDEVAATGGGGAACSMAGAGAEGTSTATLALLVLVVGLLLRRRAVLVGALLAVGLFVSGCHTDPFCLNCEEQEMAVPVDMTQVPDLTTPPDLAMPDLQLPPDLSKVAGCTITNGGVEICDHIDNDCNGITDDVNPAILVSDPNNCGSCFHSCDYTATHQYGVCEAGNDGGMFDGGMPTCFPGGCLPGYVTLPGQAACAYQCTPTVPPTEVCDGKDNDCNGITDDGFGFPHYNKDVNNCGGCGNVCNLPGAVPTCATDPTTMNGICAVDHCINDGKNTFKWKAYDPTNPTKLNTTGCDYHCPSHSTTVTTGSQDCDTVTCAFPAEVCNGIDDDCDFIVDDHLTDTGGACGAMNVGICMAGVNNCVSGVLVCQGAVKPTVETCNGKDDDCDGVVDDHLTDPWLNQACCPTGNLSDCTNTMTGTRCQQGAYQCVTGAKTCSGGVSKSAEVCNGVDDNCDGIVDNVPGVGAACSSGGVNTTGVCTAAWSCNGGTPGPGPSQLTCQQVKGPTPEVCNGLDDNCNGMTDEGNPGGGAACGGLCPGGLVANCVGQCKAGSMNCVNGSLSCTGSVGPSPEVCDGIDNDCNGIVDDVPGIGQACTGTGILTAGICTATYVCTGTKGPGPNGLTCTQKQGPKTELCNGIDDDCDGIVDDHLADPALGVACGQNCPGGNVAGCIGACKAGSTTCSGGVVVCTGSTKPGVETCNGIDDDCNGLVDDPFTASVANGGYADGAAGQMPLYNSSPTTCGSCTGVCGLANAVNGCHSAAAGVAGTCYVIACNAGFNYVPSTPCGTTPAENGPGGVGCNYACPVFPATPEVCDGKDNDCNGATDEAQSACYTAGLTPPAGLCATAGVCSGAAVTPSCLGSAGWDCSYCGVPNADTTTTTINGKTVCNLAALESECDCLDNNCNGVTDKDGFITVGNACSAGSGLCSVKGTVMCNAANKTAQCMTGSGGACFGATVAVADYTKATNELCDNIDNDCNGLTDESSSFTVSVNGTPTTFQGWHDPVVAVPKPGGGTVYVYAFEASRPDATATSAGAVTTRACANQGTLPWSTVTQTQAVAACAAVKDGLGNPMRLCTANEWQAACEGPTGPANAKWSFSVNPINYTKQICNNLDESAAPAAWATGSPGAASAGLGEFCYTPWPGGQIHDLSGNLSEWTSTPVLDGTTTYYQLRGGAFDSPSGGTTCEFNFDIAQATFANSDVGFRCCADAPACGDTTSDPNNCGSCGKVCSGATPVCNAGVCSATCGGLSNCSNACVNLQTNAANCGACGTACAPGQTCTAGACGCAAPSTLCGGACTNTQTDPLNCGGCGKACTGASPVCQSGACVAMCTNGFTSCGSGGGCCCTLSVCSGQCVNTQSDNNNCGVCGKACGAGNSCQNGSCCTTGQTNCGGTCTNLLTDTNNCNACGNVCPAGHTCVNGSCCGAGLLSCGAQCVNPQNDPNNCGACFNVCPAAAPNCNGGGCCAGTKTSCSGVCVDLTSDNNNCGKCGNACGGGAQCQNGTCSCGTYESYCGGTCIFSDNDFNNCGSCGHVCAAGQVCSNGLCTGACSQGSSCSGSCFPTTDDPFKCGAGCTNCTGGNSCVGGGCAMGIIPFVPNPGGICTSNGGLGPVIQLSPSAPPRGTGGGSQCSGNIAGTTFGFGLCACASFNGGGSSTVDAWDSSVGPYNTGPNAGNGTLGGSLAVNTSATISSTLTISGDLDSGGNLSAKATVSEQVHIGGNDSGSSLSCGGLAEIFQPQAGGTISTNASFAPNVGLYVGPGQTCAGYTIQNGTCHVENPWNGPASQPPCKRCAAAQQVTIDAYIANYATQNDNAGIGLTAAVRNTIATNASGTLTLPCGYYYLDAINLTGSFTIVATGNTALFIGGNITGGSSQILTIDATPGAKLDVFVQGSVQLGQAKPSLGDLLYPANIRMYLACSSQTTAGSCTQNSDCCSGTCTGGACSANTPALQVHNPTTFAADFYLPNGIIQVDANSGLFGSIFAHDYQQGSGNFNLHYDRASASSGSVCPPPAGNPCTSCLDCSNQACNGGVCGGCNSDADCCAPLRCVPPNSTHSGTCQFTSF